MSHAAMTTLSINTMILYSFVIRIQYYELMRQNINYINTKTRHDKY